MIKLPTTTKAQTPESAARVRAAATLEGMVAILSNGRDGALAFGGPNLMLKVGPKWGIGASALPSLYVVGPSGKLRPRLGFAPRLDYQHWTLLLAGYYFDDPERWLLHLGLGYRFYRAGPAPR